MGGIRYLTGHPGGPTSRTGIALADETASLFAVIGTLAGLVRRSREGRGDVVDVALYEAVFALMEAAVTEYKHTGKIREAAGSAYTGVAPTNTYRTADGKDVVIGGNSDVLFPRLMRLIGREDLAANERYRTNPGRASDTDVLDRAVGEWTASRTLADCLAALERAEVPMSEAPGGVDRLGQVALGADNDEVYGDLGVDEDERARLHAEGVI